MKPNRCTPMLKGSARAAGVRYARQGPNESHYRDCLDAEQLRVVVRYPAKKPGFSKKPGF